MTPDPKIKQHFQRVEKFSFECPHPAYEGESITVHCYFERSGVRIDRGTGTVLIPRELAQAVAECMLSKLGKQEE